MTYHIQSYSTNRISQYQGSILQYAIELSEKYLKTSSEIYRKKRGQFFTPQNVARFMATLSTNKPKRVLDPGAGFGILSCAIAEKYCNFDKNQKLHIDLYEIDLKIIPFLEKVMQHAKKYYTSLTYDIYPTDFVKTVLNKKDNFFEQKLPEYDLVIANPPYFKLSSTSPLVRSAKINGMQGNTNIYSLIMFLSKELISTNGELIFIVPRSFCNGLYFKYFRKSMLNDLSLDYIHIFESRKDVFYNDSILQENIIVKFCKKTQKEIIGISSSKSDYDLEKVVPREINTKKVVDTKSGYYTIGIPFSKEGEQIMDIVQNWENDFSNLNIEISTGPIIPYRSIPWLTNKPTNHPLIWLNNIKAMKLNYPIHKTSKPQYVKHCHESQKWLVPNSNYVLLRRFSAKEDKQRIVAAPFLNNRFHTSHIGIENHVNFIYNPNGVLSTDEVFGISAILNSKMFNQYFQIINGHTQVNATDLRIMHFPGKGVILKIGNLVQKHDDWENIVEKVLTNYYFKPEGMALSYA